MKKAQDLKKKIFLIYDVSCQFPSAAEQPDELKNLFTRTAISMNEGYYDRIWRQLASKVELNANEEVRYIAFERC